MRPSTRIIVVAVAIAAVVTASMSWHAEGRAAQAWASLSGEDLGKAAAVVTILSLAISPPFYFARQWHESRAERRRASQNLYLELKDALNALDTTKSSDLRTAVTDDGKQIYFMNRILNHDFYDSLVFSGKINFVEPESQQHVQDVFHYIKDHNFCLQKIRGLEDTHNGSGDAAATLQVGGDAGRYYRMLGGIDSLLLDIVPELMDELKKGHGAPNRAHGP